MKFLEPIILILSGISLANLLVQDKLKFYIYPGHTWLVIIAIVVLCITGLEIIRNKHSHNHFSIYTLLVLIPILISFFWQPKVLSIESALDRGAIYELGGSLKQETNFSINPENRTLIDWVRIFSANPEPAKYAGQKINLEGFIYPDENLPPDQFLLSKFILSCCTADARPVGIPAFFDSDLTSPNVGEWISAKGEIVEHNSEFGRRAVIKIREFKIISEPKNPYEYQ